VEFAEHRVDKRLTPVVQQSVIELATLGFIGIIIQSAEIGGEHSLLSTLSETFFNEEELLFEQFEALHQGIFYTTIAFFLSCASIVFQVNKQFSEWDYDRRNAYVRFKVGEFDFKRETKNSAGDGSRTFERRGWSQRAKRMLLLEEEAAKGSPIKELWYELTKSKEERIAEFLRFRERFLDRSGRADYGGVQLPSSFRFSLYLEEHASKALKQLVSIEPVKLAILWLPLVSIALATEFMSDVVLGPGSEEYAIELVFVASQVTLVVWTLWNFFKLRFVKLQLRPQLAVKVPAPPPPLPPSPLSLVQ
jgi:hypothetical protein